MRDLRCSAHGHEFWQPLRKLSHKTNEERQSLLDLACAGSIEAHGSLLLSYWWIVYRHFSVKLQGRSTRFGDPEDLAQEVSIRAHAGFAGFQGHLLAQYYRWLMKIAANLLNDVLRSLGMKGDDTVAGEVPLDEELVEGAEKHARARSQPLPEEILAALDEAEMLKDAINELPADERQILVWRLYDGFTFVEIAARFGLTPKAVIRALERAMNRLRGRLMLAPV
jgi:RNA polymerase sigma-70 factor, ECF subfamily